MTVKRVLLATRSRALICLDLVEESLCFEGIGVDLCRSGFVVLGKRMVSARVGK